MRVRFAPSPTGYLHVGGARTALFNYFLARRFGGQFILRIEDTDLERSKKEFEIEILESMKWLGLNWNEGPFYQTQRFDLYRKYVDRLLEEGAAYRCYCTVEEVEQMRADATARGDKPMYNRKCRDLKTPPSGKPFVVRFRTPLDGNLEFRDGIKGPMSFDLKEIDDFVILRSSSQANPAPMYNFTVVVDDYEMGITHVVRGEDHLSNTPKQILMLRSLGAKLPEYAHIPLILGADRSKLSKRHGGVSVAHFRSEGYLPEAMLNYLIRLGWSHGDQEFFTVAELEKLFDLSGCGASGSIFDTAKLDWMNAQFLKKLSPDQVVRQVQNLLSVDLGELQRTEVGLKLLSAVVERSTTLKGVVGQLSWYVQATPTFEAGLIDQLVRPAPVAAWKALVSKIETLEPFNAESVMLCVKETAKEHNVKMPELAKAARVLLTGTLASPDLGLVFASLGRQRCLDRLKKKEALA
jgi:glutamyl-tRNA synthetase